MKSLILAALLIGCSLASSVQADEFTADAPAYFAGAAGMGQDAFPIGFYAGGYSALTTYTSWPQTCCNNVWDGYCSEKGHCGKLCSGGHGRCHYAVGKCHKQKSCHACGKAQPCGCDK